MVGTSPFLKRKDVVIFFSGEFLEMVVIANKICEKMMCQRISFVEDTIGKD